MYAGRGLHRFEVQSETDWREALQRRMGWGRRRQGAATVGVRIPARLQRAWHAHIIHGRRESRRHADRAGGGLWQEQRNRAARAHRGVQGTLVYAGRRDRFGVQFRSRGRHRSGGRGRRGRHQLLDQRHDDQLPRSSGDCLPVRGRCGCLRRSLGRQLGSHHRHRGAPVTVDHDGRGGYAQS